MVNFEGMKHKFTVIKTDDILNYFSVYERNILDILITKICDKRRADGKKQTNEYLVINTDEPYAPEIVEILKKNKHWG